MTDKPLEELKADLKTAEATYDAARAAYHTALDAKYADKATSDAALYATCAAYYDARYDARAADAAYHKALKALKAQKWTDD